MERIAATVLRRCIARAGGVALGLSVMLREAPAAQCATLLP